MNTGAIALLIGLIVLGLLLYFASKEAKKLKEKKK